MNFDELMAVWRTQDAAPLHGLNETLLRLALRQNEAKRQKWRRIERWIIYVLSAGVVAGLALFLANMILLTIYRDDMNGLTGWDLVLPVVGAAAALICARAVYVGHRAQARREQRFGESLRDQLCRSIAQLDYQATTLHRTLLLVLVLLTGICPIALLLALFAAQREALQRRWIHDRLAELNVRLRGGDRRLVNPPADTRCCVAAQAPAGDVAERARRPISPPASERAPAATHFEPQGPNYPREEEAIDGIDDWRPHLARHLGTPPSV